LFDLGSSRTVTKTQYFPTAVNGNIYAINQGGTLRQKIFQQLALGAAYTPASLGSDGKIYSQNAGHLFVAGN
jgi:hypothetical protein